MRTDKSRRILVCLLTLPISGGLAMAALFLRKFALFPGEAPGDWAEVVTSGSYAFAQYGYVIAYILPFFGFWALYASLKDLEKVERIAFWGFMGALLGTALALPTLGVFTFVSPEIGRLYLAGESQLPQMITDIGMGSSMVLGIPAAFLFAGGCLLLGIAVWRSGTLTRWPGVMLALHGFCLVFGFGIPLLVILSWVLLVLSGSWLAWDIGKGISPGK